MRRGVIFGLSGCLLLAHSGCQTGAQRAGDHLNLVQVGMTRDQVEDRLGGPDGWEKNVNGYEVWAYSYRPDAGTFIVWKTVDLVEICIGVALMFGLVWISRGVFAALFRDSGPSVPLSPSEKDDRFQRFVFRIGFHSETGRVAYVSSPLPE